jgi:hypothetical protein
MSLSVRHRWCMDKVLEAFSPELTNESVQQFIRQDTNLQRFNAFFKGDGSGRLFVFFQPEMNEDEVCMCVSHLFRAVCLLLARVICICRFASHPPNSLL